MRRGRWLGRIHPDREQPGGGKGNPGHGDHALGLIPGSRKSWLTHQENPTMTCQPQRSMQRLNDGGEQHMIPRRQLLGLPAVGGLLGLFGARAAAADPLGVPFDGR